MVGSQPHHMMGTWPIHVMHSHSNTPDQIRKPARAGGHRAGFPLECLQSGLGLIADPIVTARH